MSFPDTRIKCNRCSETYSADVLVGRFVYEFQDGVQLPIERKFGWCDDCGRLQAMEDLDPEGITKQIDELYENRKEHSGLLKSLSAGHKQALASIQNQLARLERLRGYLANRAEPAKCLNCGSESISEMAGQVQDWQHPNCGGNFTSETGKVFYSDIYPLRVYDEDGLLIRQIADDGW